jgi:hypothetical protein
VKGEMMDKNPVLIGENEQGVTIITVLLLLLLLSIVSVTATKTVINEKKIVRSEAVFEKSFYYAEAGALEGIQKLENASEYKELLPSLVEDDSENKDLLYSADEDDPDDDSLNLDLNSDGSFDQDDISIADVSDTNGDSNRIAVLMPIEGSSLSLASTRLYTYMAYGTSNANGGNAKVKVGYKKRF